MVRMILCRVASHAASIAVNADNIKQTMSRYKLWGGNLLASKQGGAVMPGGRLKLAGIRVNRSRSE